MKPHYTETGLAAYLEAVPLSLPVPPGDPAGWTCIYTLLGPRLAFLRDGYQEVASETLLRELLELAGRPCSPDESRFLLLVTPVAGDVTLESLLQRALRGRCAGEAVRLLGHLGGPDAEAVLLERVDDPDYSVRYEAIRALGTLGGGADRLVAWDGDTDSERLLALVRQGVLPEELPAGELEPLAAWLPSLDPDAGREVLSALDMCSDTLTDAVAHVFVARPDAAAELAEVLVGQLPRVCERPVWARAIAAAGEEAFELLLEALSSEDWRFRMGAVIVLGTLPEVGDRGRAALRRALTDDDPDVRREAAVALGAHGGRVQVESWTDDPGFLARASGLPWGAALTGGAVPMDAIGLLARRDSGAVLARACLALAFAHPSLVGPALDAVSRDPGYDVPLEARQAAAAGLLATGTVPSGVPALQRVLLRGLGSNGQTGPVDRVVAEDLVVLAARDGDWQIRLAALGLLHRTGEAARFDGLLAMLAAVDSDSDVRDRAASMRRPRYEPRGTAEALARLVTSSRVDETQRARALDEIAERDPGLADTLALRLLDHTDRGVAVLAGKLAGRGAPPEAAAERVRRGLAHLRQPDWIKREAGAALLGSIDPGVLDAALYEELVETLEAASTGDADADVQRMAAWAATRLRGRRE